MVTLDVSLTSLDKDILVALGVSFSCEEGVVFKKDAEYKRVCDIARRGVNYGGGYGELSDDYRIVRFYDNHKKGVEKFFADYRNDEGLSAGEAICGLLSGNYSVGSTQRFWQNDLDEDGSTGGKHPSAEAVKKALVLLAAQATVEKIFEAQETMKRDNFNEEYVRGLKAGLRIIQEAIDETSSPTDRLLHAISVGDVAAAKQAIDDRADIKGRAVYSSCWKDVQKAYNDKLLSTGTYKGASPLYGACSPLMLAVAFDEPEIAQLLVDAGAPVDTFREVMLSNNYRGYVTAMDYAGDKRTKKYKTFYSIFNGTAPVRHRWETEYVVQGYYTGGWSDLTHEESRADANAQKRTYDENEQGIPHRVVTRKVKVD